MTLNDMIVASGLKRNFIAQRLGVDGSRVTRWAQSKRVVPPEFIVPMAKLLRVRPADLRAVLANGNGSDAAGGRSVAE